MTLLLWLLLTVALTSLSPPRCAQDEEGEIALDGDHALFNAMIDEFLEEKKTLIYAEGSLVKKGTRSTVLVRKGQEAAQVIAEAFEKIETAPVDLAEERRQQEALQAESELYLRDLDAKNDKHVELETCQQYLKEERIVVSACTSVQQR